MARSIKWTAEKYKIAVLGDELPGLRKIVEGFEASDGYDLRYIDSWTSSRKRRVRDYYNRIRLLEAQQRRIVFPRNEDNLRALQKAFHGDVASKKFKAAFVPWTEPIVRRGLKQRKPRIVFLSSGGIAIDTGMYRRVFEPFDQVALAKNAEKEVKRVFDRIPDAKLMYVQVGEFQTLTGNTRANTMSRILKWIHHYDGVKQLPSTSGNRGDDPRHHHYSLWLNGVVGYELPKSVDEVAMARRIEAGRQEAKARRKKQDKKMISTKRSKK